MWCLHMFSNNKQLFMIFLLILKTPFHAQIRYSISLSRLKISGNLMTCTLNSELNFMSV